MRQVRGLLVKVKGDGSAFAATSRHLRAGALEVEPILRIPGGSDPGALAPDRGATWLKVRPRSPKSDNAWDEAHRLVVLGPVPLVPGDARAALDVEREERVASDDLRTEADHVEPADHAEAVAHAELQRRRAALLELHDRVLRVEREASPTPNTQRPQ